VSDEADFSPRGSLPLLLLPFRASLPLFEIWMLRVLAATPFWQFPSAHLFGDKRL
jgi:hypothetical protein